MTHSTLLDAVRSACTRVTGVSDQVAQSAGISAAFLERVLRRPVTSIKEERLGADWGFAGTVLRLSLLPSAHQPAAVVAKLGPPTDTAIEREAAFYRDIASAVSAPGPRCWYAGATPTGQPVIILDDLSDAMPGDVLVGTDPDRVAAVLHQLAAMWRHGDKPPADSLPGWSATRESLDQWQRRYAEQWDNLASQLRLQPEIIRMGEQLRTKLVSIMVRLSSGSVPTVIHGDLHLDNVLFPTADGSRPIVIDWASARIGPLAVDVAPFLASSLSPEDHHRHATDLINDLRTDLPAQFSRDFEDQTRCALLRHFAGVIGWLSRPSTDNPRETALREASLQDGRLVNALLHWDAHLALR